MAGLFALIYGFLYGTAKIHEKINNTKIDTYAKNKAIENNKNYYLNHRFNTVYLDSGIETKETTNENWEKIEVNVKTGEVIRNISKEREEKYIEYDRKKAIRDNKKYYPIYYGSLQYEYKHGIKWELDQLKFKRGSLIEPVYKIIGEEDGDYYHIINFGIAKIYYNINKRILTEDTGEAVDEPQFYDLNGKINLELSYNYGEYICNYECCSADDVIKYFNTFQKECIDRFDKEYNPFNYGDEFYVCKSRKDR